MELALICLLIGVVIGAVLGYWLATHIHSVAAAATTAATRAVTIPGSAIAEISAVSPSVASQLQTQTAALKDHITETVAAAVTALQPKA